MAINNGVSLFVMMSYGVSLCKMRCRWHWCICWRRYRALCYGTIRVMQFYDPSLTSSLLSSLLWAIYFFDRHHCHGCSKFKITKVCFTAELFQLSSARSAFVPLFPQVISIFSVYNRIPMIYSTALCFGFAMHCILSICQRDSHKTGLLPLHQHPMCLPRIRRFLLNQMQDSHHRSRCHLLLKSQYFIPHSLLWQQHSCLSKA